MMNDLRSSGGSGPQRRVAVVVVHGVGETVPGYAMNELIDTMQKEGSGTIEAEPYSEVRTLAEAGSAGGFPAYSRTARFPATGEVVRFHELYWADLSRVLPGRLNSMLGGLRIAFESHQFIDAMLPKLSEPRTRALRRLLLFAGALLRGPIAGLNICMIAIALVYYFGRGFLGEMEGDKPLWLIHSVMAVLFLVSLFLLVIGFRRHTTEWKDVYVGTLVFSVMVSGFAWLLAKYPDIKIIGGAKSSDGGSFCLYVERFYYIMQSFWGLWWLVFSAAVVLLVFVVGRGRRRNDEAGRAAAVAAVNVAACQAALWVSIICVLSLPILREAAERQVPLCGLDKISVFFATTAGALFLVGAVAIATYTARFVLSRLSWLPLETRARLMPRMLFGRGITATIFVGALLNVSMFTLMYFISFHENNELFRWIAQSFDTGGGEGRSLVGWVNRGQAYLFAGSSIVAAGVGLLMAGGFVSAIHIVRDLIDHQYKPELGFSHYLLPRRWRSTPSRPRRLRIRERLDTLAREVVCKEPFDDVVFITHSQGSVIVYDYLRAGGEACERLLSVRPHVITAGSPLGHLYQVYFQEYADLEKSIADLGSRLASWTNVYRIDDYVGRQIGDKQVIINKVLPPGGHMNYWQERELCALVLDRIRTAATKAKST